MTLGERPIVRAMARIPLLSLLVALAGGSVLTGCNALTGADSIELSDELGDDAGGGGATGGNGATAGAGQTGSGQAGSGQAGSGQAASGQAGSGQTGSGASTGAGMDCMWPAGPYGVGQGDTLPSGKSWQGYAAGSTQAGTVALADFYDCDGSRGINAVLFDTSQFG